MTKETKCERCGKPIPRDQFGRARRFHPECGKAARSEAMQGNQLSVGHGRPKVMTPFPKHEADAVRHDAYRKLPEAQVRETAIAYWGEAAELCYRVYDHANKQLFDGAVALPLIQICRVMPYGRCLGLSHTSDIDRPVIDLFASLWKSPKRYASMACTMMHEMLHFHNARAWRERGSVWWVTSHENELWLDSVKSIQRILKDSTMRVDDAPFEHWPIFSDRRMAEIDRLLAGGKWPW